MKKLRRVFAPGTRYYHRLYEQQHQIAWHGRGCSQFSLYLGLLHVLADATAAARGRCGSVAYYRRRR